MANYIKTNEKIEVENYPYGFKLKCTLFDTMEFDVKKGYRHVTQTTNPKTNRLNAPKKSTYSKLLVRYYDENNHIKLLHFDFNGDESINKATKFLSENFDLFTKQEIEYFYNELLYSSMVDMKVTLIYCGAKVEDLKPLYHNFIQTTKEGLKSGENLFNKMVLDTDKINATKQPNYNPFKITEKNMY